MFNIPILKQDFKINDKRLLVMFSLELVSILLAVGICEMNLVEISDIFWDTIPIILIPMFLEMMLAYQLITRRAEDGTMEFLLATDIGPGAIMGTKAVMITATGFLMIIFVTVVGAFTKVYRLAGIWDQASFIMLNVGALCLQFFISGFCFFAACRSRSLLSYIRLAVVLPVLMYVIYVAYYLVEQLFFLQYITLFSLFRQVWYAKGYFMAYLGMGIFLLGGAAFFYLGRKSFYSRILKRN